MGKKRGGRRRKGADHDDEEADEDSDDHEDDDHDNKNNNEDNASDEGDLGEDEHSKQQLPPRSAHAKSKNLNFAERRELNRHMSAIKRKNKQKCFVCGKAGHVRRDCPGILDDGKGESKYHASKHQRGGSGSKKNNAENSSAGGISAETWQELLQENVPVELFPPKLQQQNENASEKTFDDVPPFFDAGCDMAASLEYIRAGRGKHKISTSEALNELQIALDSSYSYMRGIVCRTPPLKPARPWRNPVLEDADFSTMLQQVSIPVFFLIGLGRDFLFNDADLGAARDFLLDIIRENNTVDSTKIAGIYSDLDYTTEGLKSAGCDAESQLRRLRASCQAAGAALVPIQIRLSPTAASLQMGDNGSPILKDTPYAKVLVDFSTVLQEILAEFPMLKIHLSCWSGLSQHLLTFWKSYPENIYAGFDSQVTFSKATHLQELCAVDMNFAIHKFVLETANTIPSTVANKAGRRLAFSHSGLVPFVAAALANHSKIPSAVQVAQTAAAHTVALYPSLARQRQNEPTPSQATTPDLEAV